ncbi:MAG: hypothetical protein JO056_10085 [Alphaproteobacteria bacterium]|nr:hypothetical protein [Alphaproteobacteria bacterium]
MLNVGELQTMLGSGDLKVRSSSVAKDISIDQQFSWTSASRLTLDAQQSVIVNKQVTVTGKGSLTVTTNDVGNNGKSNKKNGGEFIVASRGSVQFWDLASNLIIDGNSYALVADLQTLATGIAANRLGFFALAIPYDASIDGTYTVAPITTGFRGAFEGLGNEISNLSFNMSGANRYGLFAYVHKSGRVRNTRVHHAKFAGLGLGAGGIVSNNEGAIAYSSASAEYETHGCAGGLVCQNEGSIVSSHAVARIHALSTNNVGAGGLAGYNSGTISGSYAEGSIAVRKSSEANVGGLVSENAGVISNSYSLVAIADGRLNCCSSNFGGLVGLNLSGARISSSYSGGVFKLKNNETVSGGLIGFDSSTPGDIESSYWDIDVGVSDPSQGAGNILNDPGITGLTTKQFQKKLPNGFDPAIWGQAPNINNGYPYLLANPPR